MEYYPSLHELLAHSPKSKELYRLFTAEGQRALKAHERNIHTYADLKKIAILFDACPCRK